MSKKILFTLGILISLVFCFNVCFATGEGLESAANGIRNVVGGVENTVENAAMDISNMSKDTTGSIENGMNDTANSIDNRMNDARNNTGLGNTNTNDGYTAARTDTRMATTGDDTLLGMSSDAWIWVIMAIAAILIIGLVWYYSAQITNNNHNRFD